MAAAGCNVIRLAFVLSLCFPVVFALRNVAESNTSTVLGSTWLARAEDHSRWLVGLAESAQSEGHAAHGHDQHPRDNREGDRGGDEAHSDEEGTHCVAVCLLSGILLSPMVLHMALSKGVLSYLTLRLVDNTITIFIAIIWCEVFRQTIKTFKFRDEHPLAVDVFCFAVIFVLYAFVVLLVYCCRKDTVNMMAISGCGGHFIAFIGMAAGREIAKTLSDTIANQWIVALILLAFTILLVVAITLYAKLIDRAVTAAIPPSKELEVFDEIIDEMEMETEGLIASFLLTQCLRYFISGAAAMQEHSHVKHPAWGRQFMLAWAVGLTVLLVVIMPRLSKMVRHNRNAKKVVLFVKILLIMMFAWGYMLWAEWLFFEAVFSGDGMFAHLIFALLITIIGLLFLLIMAKCLEFHIELIRGRDDMQVTHLSSALRHMTPRSRSEAIMRRVASAVANNLSPDAAESLHEAFQKAALMTVTGISFVIAWSWEHCFLIAFDAIGVHYSVGYGGLVPKLALGVAAPFMMLPTYIVHIKPRVVGSAKEYGLESESSGSDSMSDKEPSEKSIDQHVDC